MRRRRDKDEDKCRMIITGRMMISMDGKDAEDEKDQGSGLMRSSDNDAEL